MIGDGTVGAVAKELAKVVTADGGNEGLDGGYAASLVKSNLAGVGGQQPTVIGESALLGRLHLVKE